MTPVTPSAAKPANADYESDIANTLSYSRWFLRVIGLWSILATDESRAERLASKCLLTLFFLSVSFPILPTTLHAILRDMDPTVRVLSFGPMVTHVTAIGKYVMIIVRRERIKWCMRQMRSDWMTVASENERAIMTRNARVCHTVTMMCCAFIYSSGFFYNAVVPVAKSRTLNANNETVRLHAYRGFDLFVDPQISPNYEIIFAAICVSAFFRYTVIVATCSLVAVLVTHACGQIRIVMARLDGLFDELNAETNADKLQERMASLVCCHVQGLRLSAKIDESVREICLIEVCNATFMICIIQYYIMTEWANSETLALITYSGFLIAYTFNIFILCYIGELLREQVMDPYFCVDLVVRCWKDYSCLRVGNTSYLIDWYRLPGKTGLALVMILAMANIPRKITAGQMLDLSVANFGMIIKTSVAYLNMLRATSTD